jgi:CHAT domain-containing protein
MALVEHFHGHLAEGQDEGSAVQHAILELVKEFGKEAVPFYWAGFNLVGNTSYPILTPAR